MQNNSVRKPGIQPGITGDGIILLVFLIVGGLLFAAFMMGSVFNAGTTATVTPSPTASISPGLLSTAGGGTTRPVTLSRTLTPLAPGTMTSTPLKFRTFTPRPPVNFYPTYTPYLYKSPTPIRTKTLTPTMTVTRTATVTKTPTLTRTPLTSVTPTTGLTPTITMTFTPTVTVTFTFTSVATLAPTATGTITPIPTQTNIPIPTELPAALACIGVPTGGSAPVKDTWVDSVDLTSHGSQTALLVNASATVQQRTLFQFTAPIVIPNSANLYLHITSQSAGIIKAYRLTREFDDNANWIYAKPDIPLDWSSSGGDYAIPAESFQLPGNIPQDGCWVSLNVISIVNGWISDPTSSNGIILLSGPDGPLISISSIETSSMGARLEIQP